VIFGDSRIIIQAIISKKKPKHVLLAQVYSKVSLLLSNFRKIKIYHVLRALNSLADTEANRGSLLSKSTLQVNGEDKISPIP
jgi:hypothetical protein